MNNVISSFKFKPITVKTLRTKSSKPKGVKAYCVCIEDEKGEYKAHVNITDGLDCTDTLVIPFTLDSYILKGKTNVFSKKPDKKGKFTRYIRSKEDATHFPGLPEIYTPFRTNYVYVGHVIKVDGHYMFKVDDFIDHYINAYNLVPDIKLNIVLPNNKDEYIPT